MPINKVHIGELIEKRRKEVGMTKAELGRRINTSRQNINSILKKEHISTDLLVQISRELDHNFFEDYAFQESLENGLLPSFIQLKGVGLTIQLESMADFTAFMKLWEAYQRGKDLEAG